MGYRVRSALVTAMLRAMVEELSAEASDPGNLLTRMNCDLRIILRESDDLMFATAYYLVIHATLKRAWYAAAGHPLPLHLRRAPGLVERLGAGDSICGPAIGLFGEPSIFQAKRIRMAGPILPSFTMRLFEAVN